MLPNKEKMLRAGMPECVPSGHEKHMTQILNASLFS
jgi:hypothetical protein